MSLNLEEKKAVVAEMSSKLAQAQAIVLADYRGLGVHDMTQLRTNARNKGVYLRVFKNTLARRAFAGTPFERRNPYQREHSRNRCSFLRVLIQ